MLGAGSALLWPQIARTQQSQRVPTIEEYNPKSTLVTKEHKPERAKFPFIDIHSHHWNPTPEHVDQLVKEMDTINLRVLVNLSGGSGEELRKTVATMKGRYPDRFVVSRTRATRISMRPGTAIVPQSDLLPTCAMARKD